MQKSKFSDRLISDDASSYLGSLPSEQRRPLLKQNSLPAGGSAFKDDERAAVFQILVDHSSAPAQ